MTKERDWTKIKYYPVSIEKLKQASMREVAYLIAPMNIGEDYEYFDEVKHLLVIPEPPKTLEQISQELKQKGDEIVEKFKRNSYASKLTADKNYEYKFDKIIDNFEYACKNGNFPLKLNLAYTTTGLSLNNCVTSNFVIKPNTIGAGYWDVKPNIQIWLQVKPNWLVRKCAKIFFDFGWKDG